MTADHDQFDIDAIRINPTDPTLVPRVVQPKRGREKWERKFIIFPWPWLDRLKATKSGATCRLALFLVYEHWRTGGRPIKLTNTMAAGVGVSPDAKGRALDELEQIGLVKVERQPRKSPRITLLVDPLADDP